MKTKHRAEVFFSDLSIEQKRQAVKTLFKYYKAFAKTGTIPVVLHVACLCVKVDWEYDNSFIQELHNIVADHLPLLECKKCGMIMEDIIYNYHMRNNCDLKKAAIEDRKEVEK